MKKWTNTVRVKKQKIIYGAGGSSEDGEVFFEEQYDYPPLVSQLAIAARQGQKENKPSNDISEKVTWDVGNDTPRRFTRVRRAPDRFDDYDRVAIEDSATIKEAMKSSD